MYERTTNGVVVRVTPSFLAEQSQPDEGRFVWAYTVEIENAGDETVQLIARRWRITDGAGETHDVAGAGVVGEQPILRPGDRFQYTSGAPLATPSGMMEGSYAMKTAGGDIFNAQIPAFSLDSPFDAASRRPH